MLNMFNLANFLLSKLGQPCLSFFQSRPQTCYRGRNEIFFQQLVIIQYLRGLIVVVIGGGGVMCPHDARHQGYILYIITLFFKTGPSVLFSLAKIGAKVAQQLLIFATSKLASKGCLIFCAKSAQKCLICSQKLLNFSHKNRPKVA